ncbi:TrmB family transcriptional regulator [Patescibacteria group bacterium]
MYSLIRILQQIGLTEKESKAYIISLKIGTNPASTIAKHANLNRCTCYSILDSLVEKGLILQYEKNKIRFFTAVEPKYLLNYIEDKKRTLSHYKNAIDEHLPELESLKGQYQIIPNVKSYVGKEGLDKIFKEIIKETTLWIWAENSKRHHEFFTKHIPDYLNKYKSINLILNNKNQLEKHHIINSSELKQIPSIKPLQCIGKDRIFIISTVENYAVEIANSDIVNQFRTQFEKAWKK